MTLALLEAAIDAMYAYLSANIVAKTAVINARYSDAYTLEDIAAWYKGAIPINWPLTPSICIVGGAQDLSDVARLGVNDVDIVVMHGDPDPEVRFRKLCRYVVVILELLESGNNSSYSYIYQMRDKIKLSDVVLDKKNDKPYLQAISIPITLSRQETY